MKTRGLEYWEKPNVGARTNIGFSALPGGERSPLGGFHFRGKKSSFWTSSKQARSYADLSNYTEEQRYQCTGTPKFDQAYYVSLYHDVESTGFSREEKRELISSLLERFGIRRPARDHQMTSHWRRPPCETSLEGRGFRSSHGTSRGT